MRSLSRILVALASLLFAVPAGALDASRLQNPDFSLDFRVENFRNSGMVSMRQVLASSILTRLTAAQVADVRSGAATINLAPTLNTILNACMPGLPAPTLSLTAGVYGVGDEVIAQTCPVNIVVEAGATIKLIGGFTAGKPERGIIRFQGGAAGSTLTGAGTIDGNRAALIGSYLALPRSTQANGLYVMASQWNCVHVDNAARITVRGLTLTGCMSFAINSFGGDDFTGADLTIRDSSAATNSQVGANPVWSNIREVGIGNVVNGTAIPWFSYANVWSDHRNPKISNVSLQGYQVLIRDGTSAAPGARIGDPFGGAFMGLRLAGGTAANLSADGLSYADGRSTPANWGFHCDNCSSIALSQINTKGFYWPIHLLAPSRVTLNGFLADGAYNTAPVAGASQSACVWITPNGQMRGNPGLDSSYDHANQMAATDTVIANGTATRCSVGIAAYTGGFSVNGVRSTGNDTAGALFWAAQVGPGYPGSTAFPVRDVEIQGLALTFNGGAGIQFNDGVNIRAANVAANDNGQEYATTFTSAGIQMTAGFGGAKKNIAFSSWSAEDTQARPITARVSFVPGSAVGGTYRLVASSSAQLHVGQHVLIKSGGGAGVDINVRIRDITDDTLSVSVPSGTTFSSAACSTAMAGTVSIPAGGNVLSGYGTAFTSALLGPAYLTVAGQSLRVGQVRSDTVAQVDTPAGAGISGAPATLISCALQGLPSQQVGFSAGADPNISDISLGSPSSYRAAGNTGAQISVAPASLRDDTTSYSPTFSTSDGSGVSVLGGGSYRIDGKGLCLRGYAQITYTTAPSAVQFTLPPGMTAFGGGTVMGFNASTKAPLIGTVNGTATVSLAGLIGALVSASGDFVQFNGCMQVQ